MTITGVLDKPISVGDAIKIEAAGEFIYLDTPIAYTVECNTLNWNAAIAKIHFEEVSLSPFVRPAVLTHGEIADRLERALALLRMIGWGQDAAINDKTGHVCAGYAIGGREPNYGITYTVNNALLAHVNEGQTIRFNTVPAWNDKTGRTWTQVEEGFVGAIERERKMAAEAGELP